MITYTIDPNHTKLTFTVTGLIRTLGEFTRTVGSVTVNEQGNPQSLSVTVAGGTLDTGLLRRDQHLKTAAFLDVEHYPAITYRSHTIEQIGMNRYVVRGTLRLRGQAHDVTLDVTLRTELQPNGARLAHVTGIVPRLAFGVPISPIMRALLLPLIGGKVAIDANVSLVPMAATVDATALPAT